MCHHDDGERESVMDALKGDMQGLKGDVREIKQLILKQAGTLLPPVAWVTFA
jgi:hypothetical protein